MYDAIVLTLGFEPGPLVRALASHTIVEGGDILIFVPHYEDERAQRAFEDFRRICSMLFSDEQGKIKVNLKRISVNVDNIEQGIAHVKEILREYVNKKVAICLSGGMRSLCITVLLASFLINWKKKPLITVYIEGRGKYVEIPFIVDLLRLVISDVKLEILRILREGPKTIGELTIILNKDRSTIYRHLKWLAQYGLVTYEGKLIKLTKLGYLAA